MSLFWKRLYICIFIISAVLLAACLLHTKHYNDALTGDFIPNEKYTDYLDNNRMEDVDIQRLYRRYCSVTSAMYDPALAQSIILDRDIHYYTQPDRHSDIMYTLKAGEVYYLYGSMVIGQPTVFSFPTYTRGWRYALPLADEKQYEEVNQYKELTADEKENIAFVPYTDQKYGYIQLKDLVYITRKCEYASGYFSLGQKIRLLLDDRYALGYLYGHDQYFWEEGVYISPDLYLPYWRLPEKILIIFIAISGFTFLYSMIK